MINATSSAHIRFHKRESRGTSRSPKHKPLQLEHDLAMAVKTVLLARAHTHPTHEPKRAENAQNAGQITARS